MLKIVYPQNDKKLRQQIKALKYQLTQDKNEKDKKIHQEALKALEGKHEENQHVIDYERD